MALSLMTVFRKRISCPSSESLLAFGRSPLCDEESAHIEAHLATCDFCNAELQLLTLHRGFAEVCAFVEMPAQLRRLAESLLRTNTSFKGFAKFSEYYRA